MTIHSDIGFSLDQIEAFVAAADHGSFSGAARALGKAQSTVSALITALEIDLGQELFTRAGRTTGLTRAGEELLKDARSIRLACDILSSRCAAMEDGIEESLTLAIDASAIALPRLAAALGEFGNRFPLTRLTILDTGGRGPYDLVTGGEAQIGIAISLDEYPADVNYRGIGTSSFSTVSAPDHPLAALRNVGPEDLARYRHLQVTSRMAGTKRARTGIGAQSWYFDTFRQMHEMTRAGLGWSDMPRHMIAADLASGQLVRLQTTHQIVDYSQPVDLIWSKSVKAGVAMSWLLDSISDPGQIDA